MRVRGTVQKAIHGDGQRFAPEPGQEAPMAEQHARLRHLATQVEFRDKKVLDCGCGTGYSLAFISSDTPNAHYLGIDVDECAIAYARTKYPGLDLRVMDGMALSFDSSSFDVVLSFEVLEHLNEDQQRRYISETYRVLKTGGTLVLSTPNKDVFSLGHRISLNLYHVRELTLEQLVHLLGEKYQSVDVYGQCFLDSNLRNRDFAYLNSQFKPAKRLKRRILRSLRRSALGQGLHNAYEHGKRQIGGGACPYPITITADNFAFDRQQLEVSKWFVCLCRK
jgi:2-polyprenyl-3-methyl-5-hydroxy-6-metoxy-1,4-benzoquinol methylase